jgi:hypothetical protein
MVAQSCRDRPVWCRSHFKETILMRVMTALVLAGLAGFTPFSAFAKPPAAGNAGELAPLTPEGWGPLVIGMTIDEVTEALGPDSDPASVGGAEPEFCDEFRPEGAPEGLLVMIEEGVLTRISIFDPATIVTDRGFGIGADAEEVEAAYGDAAQVMTHFYLGEPAVYIDAWVGGAVGPNGSDDPDDRGIRYETDLDGKVTSIHAGGPSIQYIEGCA